MENLALLDSGARANLSCFKWLTRHTAILGKGRGPNCEAPHPTCARFKFGDGRVDVVRFAADVPVGLAGGRGKSTTLLRTGASESLGEHLDFSRNLRLGKLGPRVPLRVNGRGRYLMNAASSEEGGAPWRDVGLPNLLTGFRELRKYSVQIRPMVGFSFRSPRAARTRMIPLNTSWRVRLWRWGMSRTQVRRTRGTLRWKYILAGAMPLRTSRSEFWRMRKGGTRGCWTAWATWKVNVRFAKPLGKRLIFRRLGHHRCHRLMGKFEWIFLPRVTPLPFTRWAYS